MRCALIRAEEKLQTPDSILTPRKMERIRGIALFLGVTTAGISVTADGDIAIGALVALLGSLYVLLSTAFGFLEEKNGSHRWLINLGDVILISAAIWFTGGIQSEYYILYFLPIMVAAVNRDLKAGLSSCTSISICYLIIALAAPISPAVIDYPLFRIIVVGVAALVFTFFFYILGHESRICDDLRDTLHQSLKRVAAVYDVAHAANMGADLTGVLSIILDHAARATNAGSGCVFLLEGEKQLKPMSTLSTPFSDPLGAEEFDAESAWKAIVEQNPYISQEQTKMKVVGRPRRVMYLPLFTPAGAVGVLALTSASTKNFSRRHIDFLISLASEAALAIENAQLRGELRRLAITDPLTGLPNRREVERRLTLELERASRYGRPLAMMMLDIDNLKSMNDHYGHALGDEVLVALARMVQGSIRSSEIVGRIGGDEFIIVLPETDSERALIIAERIIREFPWALRAWPGLNEAPDSALFCNLSIGISSKGKEPISTKELTARADAALYEAKRGGKGQARIALDSNRALECPFETFL